MKFLLIPSAKLIGIELQDRFGKIPSCLTPFDGVPILEKLYLKYIEAYDEIILVCKEELYLVKKYIESKRLKITLIELDNIKDLGYTINFGLEYIINKYSDESELLVSINFADTIVDTIETDFNDDSIYYSIVNSSQRWTTFDIENNKIIKIYDKEEREGDYFNTFVGRYNIHDINKFIYYLKKHILENKLDSFHTTLFEYNDSPKLILLKENEWIDSGHLDKYMHSKREVSARYFNTINIDRERGILTKKSTDENKFYNEILWYLKLPLKLQYLSPRIFEYSLEYGDMYVTMEYYGYNTLNELFVYGNLNKNQWEKIFYSIFNAIKDLNKFKVNNIKNDIDLSLKEMYLVKTIKRIEKLKKDISFLPFFENNIIINGITYNNLSYFVEKIENLILKYKLYNVDEFSIIHGDLCFSNILYDSNTNLIRLIDPRGKFGNFDIYGDYRYDLAKLSHSVNGKYDFIINDLFHLDLNENQINYSIEDNQNIQIAQNILNGYLNNFNFNQIKLIEGILFISMIPLHKDYPKRQIIMMATAIEILEKLM